MEGTLKIKMDKDILNNILPKNEIDNVAHGIISLNQWAIPHWDWVDFAQIGSVQINTITASHILDRLKELFPDNKQDVIMVWLNYGWQIKADLQEWECRIDFKKINYKEDIK